MVETEPRLAAERSSSAGDIARRRYFESTGRRRFVRFWVDFIKRRPLGTAGAVLIIVMLLAAAFANVIAPYDPTAINFPDLLKPPSPQHLLGADNFGRDVFSRVVFGSRTALLVGFSASLVGCTCGLVLGVVGAYVGGKTDQVIQRLMDVLLSFPLIVIAIAVVAALGTGEDKGANVIAPITVPLIPRLSRVVRSSALAVVAMPYIAATRAFGRRKAADAPRARRHPHPPGPLHRAARVPPSAAPAGRGHRGDLVPGAPSRRPDPAGHRVRNRSREGRGAVPSGGARLRRR